MTDTPDGPTPEALAKHEYERVRPDKGEDSTEIASRSVLRRRDGTALDTLAMRGAISKREWLAGNRLRADFHYAGREQRVTVSYQERMGGGVARQVEESAGREAAHQRWRQAIQAVGKRLGAVLVAVVVEDVAPSAWAEERLGYGGRSASPAGMALLRVSLASLADHYGLED